MTKTRPTQRWTQKAIYPQARTAEFCLAALERFGMRGEKGMDLPDAARDIQAALIEYIAESEHQGDLVSGMLSLGQALDDFKIFVSTVDL